MSDLAPRLLNDTLHLMMLARETALARNQTAQAEKLAPVVDELRAMATGRAAAATGSSLPPAVVGPLAQPEFQALLAAVQTGPASSSTDSSPLDRDIVAGAMAAGGMTEVDIARQLGVTREEVRLMLATSSARR